MRNNQYSATNLLALTNGSPQGRRITEQFIDSQGGLETLRDSKSWAEVSEQFIEVIRTTTVEE